MLAVGGFSWGVLVKLGGICLCKTAPLVRELGIDCTGTTHYYNADQDAVLAVNADGVRGRLPLASEKTVAKYRQAVADWRGWAETVLHAADLFGK